MNDSPIISDKTLLVSLTALTLFSLYISLHRLPEALEIAFMVAS